jgi:catechol 2,3-dioxygenase-like lactoylglutathione lyase family enzyme
MADCELLSAIPVLPARDLDGALAFYKERLGFQVAFQYGPYAGVVRGPIEIHLDGQPGVTAEVSCRIQVRGIDALHDEIKPQGVVDPKEPLQTMPFGMRQFSVRDLSGNRITFAQRVA